MEAGQILNCLVPSVESKLGWSNHPAVKMWRGYSDALLHYFWVMLERVVEIGTKYKKYRLPKDRPRWDSVQFPPWFGDEKFHASHRSNLLRKSTHYEQFGWTESKILEYVWPVLPIKVVADYSTEHRKPLKGMI